MTHPITKEQLAEFIWEKECEIYKSQWRYFVFKPFNQLAKNDNERLLGIAAAILDKVFEGAVRGYSLYNERYPQPLCPMCVDNPELLKPELEKGDRIIPVLILADPTQQEKAWVIYLSA